MKTSKTLLALSILVGLLAAIALAPGQLVGFVGSFVITGLFAAWFTIRLQRSLPGGEEDRHVAFADGRA